MVELLDLLEMKYDKGCLGYDVHVWLFADNVTGAICPVGHYCPQGSSIYIICPAGNYSDETGQADCKVCPAGFQCTGGDYRQPCPQGQYCPEGTGLTTQPCPIGESRCLNFTPES